MSKRKIWVKRPGSSPTQVTVNADDLVDDVRDVILRKYANSLGRSFDSPDVTLKILARETSNKNVSKERVLGPEEHIGNTLDAYYAGGQSIDEALIIEMPRRRTPKTSPQPGHHMPYCLHEELMPEEGAAEYFPPMPAVVSPGIHPHSSRTGPHHPSGHAIGVLTTGQIPPLPSPGGRVHRHHRPRYNRQHTSSPTILHTIPSAGSAKDGKPTANGHPAPPAPPIPTPPLHVQPDYPVPSVPQPVQSASPHPSQQKYSRKNRSKNASTSNAPSGATSKPNSAADPPPPPRPATAGLLDGTVPPINVLIVEDNVINLKLLEQFMRRLRVRWKTAMNGREAVSQWRTGGFHLVLMDIQLPVMNGLDATKEIRRLEALNGIGVFSDSPIEGKHGIVNGGTEEASAEVGEEDKLSDRSAFKSPVIIVALTASSLQSDRHEALAAGCNDFLTKPVNFAWMERKVTEWGCMQALIDFDGWRKWKALAASKTPQQEADEKKAARETLRAQFAKRPAKLPGAAAAATAGSAGSGAQQEPGKASAAQAQAQAQAVGA